MVRTRVTHSPGPTTTHRDATELSNNVLPSVMLSSRLFSEFTSSARLIISVYRGIQAPERVGDLPGFTAKS